MQLKDISIGKLMIDEEVHTQFISLHACCGYLNVSFQGESCRCFKKSKRKPGN